MRTTEQVGDGVVDWQNTSMDVCIQIYTVVRLKTVKCNIIYIFHYTDNYFNYLTNFLKLNF